MVLSRSIKRNLPQRPENKARVSPPPLQAKTLLHGGEDDHDPGKLAAAPGG